MKTVCAVLALCLTGCAAPWAGGYKVEVPVPIPCKATVPDEPAWPTDGLAPGVDVFTFTTHAQAEIELRRADRGKLVEALRGCIAPMALP